MTRIRVNPGSLQQSAGEVKSIASNIRKTGDEVWRSAGSAPSYDGQFGPKVRAIARAAVARAQKHDARMNTLSGSLSGRAAAFQAVDLAGVQGLQKKSHLLPNTSLTNLLWLATMLGITLAQVYRLIRLGSLKLPSISLPKWTFQTSREIQYQAVPAPPKQSVITEQKTVKDNSQQEKSKLTSPALVDVSPKDYSSCALYAAARRPDLGSTQSDRERFKDQAAANYICKFQEKAFQVTEKDGDLRQYIGVGYALIWEPGVAGAHEDYGHVAIVEEVGEDYVIVSHAGWSGSNKIPLSKLSQLWLIP